MDMPVLDLKMLSYEYYIHAIGVINISTSNMPFMYINKQFLTVEPLLFNIFLLF